MIELSIIASDAHYTNIVKSLSFPIIIYFKIHVKIFQCYSYPVTDWKKLCAVHRILKIYIGLFRNVKQLKSSH